MPLFKRNFYGKQIQLSFKKMKLLRPFLWRFNRNSAFPCRWREVHPVLQHMLSFLHQKFSYVFWWKQAGFKTDSFVNVTWKSALSEITDAKNQYNSIPEWFSPEMEVDWTECFLLPTSTVFCGRHFEVTFCFFSKWSLQSCRQFLKCNL